MPFYSSILQHGLMNKTGISQSCMIYKGLLQKFALLFALVGAMMVVVPMLTEQAYARTEGRANTLSTFDPPFTNVIGKLDAGKWLIHILESLRATSPLNGQRQEVDYLVVTRKVAF